MSIRSYLPKLLRTALLGVAATAWASLPHAANLTGSGSTFVHPVMLKWAASYNAKTNIQVSYQAIGSGAGIRQAKEGTVTFGATDKPLPPDELRAAGLAQFPLVIGGVVPVVNIDGVKPGQLNFSGELLADIYLGKITSWNDPAIAALNPEVKLPNMKINVAFRSDGSGTTYNWANYLSKVSTEWQTKGSIGYVELAYAVQHKMTFAKLKNKSGTFVTPTLDSFQAAAVNAGWKEPDFYEILTDAAGKDSWPITATVFVLMPKRSPDAVKSAEALKFFRWALEQGQAEAKSLDYVPLPESLVKQIETYWTQNVK
jgi:phosphate transport system substrate-binding protein